MHISNGNIINRHITRIGDNIAIGNRLSCNHIGGVIGCFNDSHGWRGINHINNFFTRWFN
jgi:hypothetical protein